jgi:hypothetical protein
MEARERHPGIIPRLLRTIWTKENLWALVLGVLLLVTFACATMGVQPEFVYTGF